MCPWAAVISANLFVYNHANFLITSFSNRAVPFMCYFPEQQSMKMRMRNTTARCSKFLFATVGDSDCPIRSSQRILSACLPIRAKFLLPTFKKRFFFKLLKAIFSWVTLFLMLLGLQLSDFTYRKIICLCTNTEFSCSKQTSNDLLLWLCWTENLV